IVGQLQNVKEGLRVAANVKNIQLTLMRARDWIKILNPSKLPVERLITLETAAIDDLDRAIRAHHIARKPHLSVAASPNWPNQFMIRNRGRDAWRAAPRDRRGGGVLQRRADRTRQSVFPGTKVRH